MERGVLVGALLPDLSRGKGFSQEQLERATGIGHSTMSGYWSGRLRLGERNARKIASALGISVGEFGFSEQREHQAEFDLRQELERIRDPLQGLLDGATRTREAVAESLASIDVRLSRIEERLDAQDDLGQVHPQT